MKKMELRFIKNSESYLHKGLQTIRVTLDKVRYLEFEEHLQSRI